MSGAALPDQVDYNKKRRRVGLLCGKIEISHMLCLADRPCTLVLFGFYQLQHIIVRPYLYGIAAVRRQCAGIVEYIDRQRKVRAGFIVRIVSVKFSRSHQRLVRILTKIVRDLRSAVPVYRTPGGPRIYIVQLVICQRRYIRPVDPGILNRQVGCHGLCQLRAHHKIRQGIHLNKKAGIVDKRINIISVGTRIPSVHAVEGSRVISNGSLRIKGPLLHFLFCCKFCNGLQIHHRIQPVFMEIDIFHIGIGFAVMLRRSAAPVDVVVGHARAPRTAVLPEKGARSVVLVRQLPHLIHYRVIERSRPLVAASVDN